jgi:hypothetical protein
MVTNETAALVVALAAQVSGGPFPAGRVVGMTRAYGLSNRPSICAHAWKPYAAARRFSAVPAVSSRRRTLACSSGRRAAAE